MHVLILLVIYTVTASSFDTVTVLWYSSFTNTQGYSTYLKHLCMYIYKLIPIPITILWSVVAGHPEVRYMSLMAMSVSIHTLVLILFFTFIYCGHNHGTFWYCCVVLQFIVSLLSVASMHAWQLLAPLTLFTEYTCCMPGPYIWTAVQSCS